MGRRGPWGRPSSADSLTIRAERRTISTVAASSTPLFVRLNTKCTTDPATGVEGCYSAIVRDRRGPPRAPRVTDRIPIILDVDTGIDDSLALLYACASPEVELVAATCVAGNVDARQVAVNTRAVLELADRADVEVALGRETPLVRPLTTTPETHGPRGIGYAELPPPSRPLSRRHAVDLLVDEARRRPGELTLVALGPLTNVALAALREPELPVLLRRLVIMGGSYRSPGNTAPTTEWNISVDPDAAAVVFTHFGAPEVQAARKSASRYDGFFGAFIHDPLALAAALDPSLVRAEALAVDVELGGILTTGETVTDARPTSNHSPNPYIT